MLSHRSSTTICQECGKRNAGSARFCSACAARLGAEPSIGAASPSTDGRSDSRPDPLHAPAADTGAFWVKLCVGALVVLLGFVAWALYMMTGSQVPAPSPTGQGPAVPEASTTTRAPPAPPPAAPAPSAASQAPPPPAALPPAPPVATEAIPPPSDVFPYKAPTAAPGAQQRRSARVRPAPAEADANAGEAPSGAWVMPSRPPAVTSSPTYRDEGPPIVPGPGPSVSDPATAGAGGTAPPAADRGPPAAVGPGPHYDFSTPGARGR